MDTESSGQKADAPADATSLETPSRASEAGESAGCGDISRSLERIEKSLERIADHLYQTQRESQVREFSLMHLAAALCLVVSVVFLVASVLNLLRANEFLARSWATTTFLGSIAMQVLSLTLFTISRRR